MLASFLITNLPVIYISYFLACGKYNRIAVVCSSKHRDFYNDESVGTRSMDRKKMDKAIDTRKKGVSPAKAHTIIATLT